LVSRRSHVLNSLQHTQPDRVVLDFGGHRSSGIAALAYPKLRKALGLPTVTVRVYDVIQQLAIIDDDVLDLLNVDTVELGRGFALDESAWAAWVLPDGTPCQVPAWSVPEREPGRWVIRSRSGQVLAHMPDGALYFEQCYWPFLEKDDLSRIEDAFAECMWTAVACPPGPEADDSQHFAATARRFRQSTDRAIIGLFGGSLLETGEFLYRIDNFLALLAAEPARAHAFLDRLTEIHLRNLERYLSAVGDSIDIILFGDDLGMQTGPLISPRMYRQFFKPRHALMWQTAKRLANVKVLLHCCGGVRQLLPDLIDAGLDAINPVQISCAGMDATGLKRDFGSEITLWGGGCDTQTILPNGTPQQVYDHARQQIGILQPDGGFVFQQVHNIMANVPAENILAMFEAVRSQRGDIP
jgi:uroporphyrinogen decarboxylase